jgi:hypothetical protein
VAPAPAPAPAPAQKKGSDDAKRAAEQMQQQLKAADDINFALKEPFSHCASQLNQLLSGCLNMTSSKMKLLRNMMSLKKAAKGADELTLINANQIIEQRIAQIEAEQEINELLAQRILMADVMRQAGTPTVYNELEEQNAALQAVLDKYPAIGAAADAAATLATSGISEMIAGTKVC